ncbi:MAG: hypothetical protein HYS70_01190 [Nitrospinae bacterium]|nr:hypothetical protein [Nitrospinota bacterium]
MATLRRRNNRYYLDWRQDGKRHNKYVGKDKKLAELALKDLILYFRLPLSIDMPQYM